tara:strand:+ start:5695 stop:6168 length:474 start_codon:yes stop_codon:yes gene_type:complete
MPVILSLTLFFLSFALPASANDRVFFREFKTDICTAWPDRLGKYDWSHCCVEHDLYLWAGGEFEQVKIANKRLHACVEKASTRFMANLMFFGIELGGYSPIRLKDKKFGNAWGETNTDSKLSSEEISILVEALNLVDLEEYNYLVIPFIQNLKKTNQ